jgi:cysteinyl-tRNA synthetase
MAVKIYNSLGAVKQDFVPLKGNKVNMYTCGVTVYDSCHIGHGRSLYVFEVIRRYLRYREFDIKLIRNITDVDDKIINKARKWAKKENISLTQAFDKVRTFYINDYNKDLEGLGIPKADVEPLATDNIKEIQDYISTLIDKGFAYAENGNVYFAPRKLKQYGELSGNSLDEMQESGRIDQDPDKNDPVDFALWKKAKQDEPSWESPWGKGRPGWHIECSVMSQKYLGVDTLDIHGGGRDLIFPHHENEKAQAEALTGKQFAKYWIHHGLLTINGQKMAKSLGNFFTIKDVLKKYTADILKIFYLQAHYSSSIDFSWDKMEEAQKAHKRIERLLHALGDKDLSKAKISKDSEAYGFLDQFIASMDDDFNMPKGLAVLFDLVSQANKWIEDQNADINDLKTAEHIIKTIVDIFELDFKQKDISTDFESRILEKIALRQKYKDQKDFKNADKIRDELLSQGIILKDSKQGTSWETV